MNYVGKLLSNFKGFYNEINSATLTGAIDIIIVQQEDGTYLTSPWHVRFGKLGVLRSREKVVDIEINGKPIDLQMKLGEAGEAFFVQEATNTDQIPAHLATSPLPDALELMERGISELHELGAQQNNERMPTLIGVHPDFAVSETSDAVEPSCDSTEPDNEESCDVTVVVEQSQDSGGGGAAADDDDVKKVESCVIDFSAISEGISTQDTGIQTVMTGEEIQTKTSKSNPASVECCLTSVTTLPPDGLAHGVDNTKVPSFVQLSSDVASSKKAAKDKRRRRRKRSPDAGRLVKNSLKLKNTHFDVVSNESGSSGDLPDEPLFDLELSGDEIDSGTVLSSVGRTVSLPLIEDKQVRTDEWADSQYAAAFHPFSDGDLTPLLSPVTSRPPTPKSDSEYEKARKYDATVQTYLTGDDLLTMDSVRWRWGELPETCEPETKEQIGITDNTTGKQKTSGGLFQFMRKTKKIRHQPEEEGIYLDDLNLNEMDPEVAALYLYQTRNTPHGHRGIQDEDTESGRGASLPQSPLTVECTTQQSTSSACVSALSMSLCGGLKEADAGMSYERFLQGLITYDEFCENPNIVSDPNFVVKMGEKYYNWQIAGPIIMSVLAFQRPLSEQTVDSLVKQHMPKKQTQRRRGWMWWSRGSEPQTDKDKETCSLPENPSSEPSSPQKAGKPEKHSTKRRAKSDGSSDEDSDAGFDPDANPLTVETTTSTHTVSVATQMSPVTNRWHKDYCKTLKLSSENIAKLDLKPGANEVSFSVTTQYQGTSRCAAYIYLWKWDDNIIISDIDGTITKSDVLGQVLPMIGKDWSQVGIAKLYSQIEKNGYKFLYLSARAIGQSKLTRDYLKSIRQGALCLPDGPLLLSPSSLISAFHKEVIERRPEDFKISCLRDIKALFPKTRNPFYSGFGNKINDVWAYQAVNIPISRIFTVNHKGELRHEMTCTFQSTYTKMTDTVDHLFPPLENHPQYGQIHSGKFPAPDKFSNFTYWREPLPNVENEVNMLLGKK